VIWLEQGMTRATGRRWRGFIARNIPGGRRTPFPLLPYALSMPNALPLLVLVPLLLAACAVPGTSPPRPLFQFGLLADVQFADKDTAGSRTYRQALPLLRACAADLAQRDLAFIAQLGDIIDDRQTAALSKADLERVLAPLEATGHPLLHVIGNHCLSVPRPDLEARLGLDTSWYSQVQTGWRFVVLDSMAFSIHSDQRLEAEAWLEGQKSKDTPNARAWNGGFGPQQLQWLAQQLQAAEDAGQHVVIFAHHPIEPASSTPSHLAWDHAEAHALITASPATVAYFNGHDHAGGYAQSNGVHFWTLPALLESTAAPNAYAIVEVWPDHLLVQGRGEVQTRKLRR
jgi:manganese-dependent ADP-ribose/CDP-alcohol diphosphatase